MMALGGKQFHPKALHICLFSIGVVSVIYVFLFSTYFSKLDSKSKVMKPEGLKTKGNKFTLQKREFVIMSGAMHYFRVPHQEWEDRLLKMKAMGLNTVDIYIPWNIHEPRPGEYSFEDEDFDLASFLYLVQAHDLYAIVRPGPYICSEWDLGGLPSWLLRDKNMKLRSMYPPFIKAVDKYFEKLMDILKPYQFSYKGPIIAFQIENEYGSYGNDNGYMSYIKLLFEKYGLEELFFVCDNLGGLDKYGTLPGVLQTINFMSKDYDQITKALLKMQPNKPIFVTELWDGWFAHWGEKNHVVDSEKIADVIQRLLQQGASFNLYMWHGGTSFGFMNGANARDDGSHYESDITSYDYDAPIDETGKIQPKYHKFKDTILQYAPKGQVSKNLPWVPEDKTFTAYGEIQITHQITLTDLMDRQIVKSISRDHVCSMEELEVNESYGQLYGYIVYSHTVPAKLSNAKKLFIHKARDFVVITINGKVVQTESQHQKVIVVNLDGVLKIESENEIVILIENSGRVNYGKDLDNQRKGILGDVLLDDLILSKWQIYPLEFQDKWVKSLKDNAHWKASSKETIKTYQPTIYKGELYVHGNAPRETFITLPGWFKGSVFLNGFNLGRHWEIGPQFTLFVPSSRLRRAENTVIIFDLHGQPKQNFIESVPQSNLGRDDAIHS